MTATLVELVDGRLVTRDADEWAHECLARHVLSLPSLLKRRAWLADFERLHGRPECERLQTTMLALYDHAQEARSHRGATTPSPGPETRVVGPSDGVAGA